MKPTALLLGLGLLLVACAPGAQDSDPLFDEDAALEEESADEGRWYGDLQLRYDHLGSLNPLSGTSRMERARGRLRFGYRGTHENLEYAIAAKLARGSDSDADTRIWLDNEKSDTEELDEAMLRWTFEDSTQLLLGKTALPLDLSPMLWDHDLRPAGVSVARSFPVGDLDRLSVVGGYFRPMHLYGDDSNLAAVQLGYHWREGAPLSASVKLGYLDFGNLAELAHEGLTRSNWREIIRPPGSPPPESCNACHGVQGDLTSDFRLVDLKAEVRWLLAGQPLVAGLDLVHNLGADRDANGADKDGDGARGSLSWGDASVPRNWEFGLAYQRFQRDAVLAAFSDDDWWFHSNARGILAHVGYGIDPTWSAHLTYVRDRRDGPFRNGPVERWLFDLRASW